MVGQKSDTESKFRLIRTERYTIHTQTIALATFHFTNHTFTGLIVVAYWIIVSTKMFSQVLCARNLSYRFCLTVIRAVRLLYFVGLNSDRSILRQHMTGSQHVREISLQR